MYPISLFQAKFGGRPPSPLNKFANFYVKNRKILAQDETFERGITHAISLAQGNGSIDQRYGKIETGKAYHVLMNQLSHELQTQLPEKDRTVENVNKLLKACIKTNEMLREELYTHLKPFYAAYLPNLLRNGLDFFKTLRQRMSPEEIDALAKAIQKAGPWIFFWEVDKMPLLLDQLLFSKVRCLLKMSD